MNFKFFYIVVAGNNKWGRGFTLPDAVKNAEAKLSGKKIPFAIYIGIVKNEATEEEVRNIAQCFNVNFSGGVYMYEEPSYEDDKMVKDFFVGWAVDDTSFRHDLAKKKKVN